MDSLAEYLPSNNVVALVIASLIFIVTVALVAKKLISFLITIVLLFFAIASGMAIANNDLVRQYFMQKNASVAEPVEPQQQSPTKSKDETLALVREELAKILHQLATLLAPDEETKTAQPPASVE
jgi:hypothetical protein